MGFVTLPPDFAGALILCGVLALMVWAVYHDMTRCGGGSWASV